MWTLQKTLRVAAVAFVILFAAAGQAVAQGDGLRELRLRDGSILYGTVIQEDDTVIRFRTTRGVEVDVARAEVVSLETASGEVVDGEFQPADPNGTRLLFAPTARSLRAGDGYVGVYEVYIPFVQVGLTDRISIGGGTPLLFGFDESERPFWFTPKVQIMNGDRVKAAAGLMHVVAPELGSVGIAYGVVTVGHTSSAVTVGAGAGYRRYEGDNGATAIVMVGAERTLRRGVKFITENYVWSGGDGIVSGAIRFYGDRLSADLGFAVPVGMGELFAFPVVNFVWAF